MAKIYLVDSENIGASWSQLLPSMSKEDQMFVFYTEKSPYISYDNLLQVIAHCQIPVFNKCYEGKNALDFQLVSELGHKLCQEPKAEFIIVSDDYGYDAAIRYWKERSYNVHRIGKKNCKPILQKKVEEKENVRNVTEVEEVTQDSSMSVQENQSVQESQTVQQEVCAEQSKTEVAAVVEQSVQEVSESQMPELHPEEIPVLSEQAKAAPEQLVAVPEQTKVGPETPEEKNVEPEKEEERPEAGRPQVEEQSEMTPEAEESTVQQDSLKENQPQKRTKERKKRHKKEPVKEPEKDLEKEPEQAVELSETDQVPQQPQKETATEEVYEEPLDVLLLGIVSKCESLEPMKDAFSVKEMFHSVSMNNLTGVNTALKILIGNELGNDIYRELKEHQDCRPLLDALYLPDAKRRFMKYVQTVLERSELEGITAKKIGDFLFGIPRKNLNSIRSAMIKEFGHEKGSLIYTVFKPHIKVLNNI